MGFKSLFNKSKKSNDDKQSPNLKARSKAMKKKVGNLKQFPIVKALKLPEVVPMAVLDELKEDAHNKDGLVRLENDGYLVLMFTEDDMEKAGLKPSNNQLTDFGQMAASFNSNQIHSATLAANIMEGQVVIIPDRDTLECLSDFDCFNPDAAQGDDLITFHWGLFPITASNEDLDAKVEMLDCTIESGAWKRVLDGTQDIRYDSGTRQVRLIETTTDGTVINESSDQAPSESTNVPDEASTSDSTSDDNSYSDDDMDSLLSGGVDDSMPTMDQQSTYTDKQDSNDHQDEVTPEFKESKTDESTNNAKAALDDLKQVANSQPTNVSDVKQMSNDDITKFLDTLQSENKTTQDKVDSVEKNPEVLNQNANQHLSRTQQSKAQPVSEYMDAFDESVIASSKDAEYGLKVDMSRINSYLKSSKPQQFKLMDSDKTDSLLGKFANNYRQDANSHLFDSFEKHQKELSLEYNERLRHAVEQIHQLLDMDNVKDNPYAREAQKLKQKYDEDLQSVDEVIKEQMHGLSEEYDKRKKQFVDAKHVLLEQNYDDQHRARLDAQKKSIKDDYQAQLLANYQAGIDELTKKRNKKAQELYVKLSDQIYQDVLKKARRYESSEREMFSMYKSQLNDLMNDRFNADVERSKALAKKENFETEIKDLRSELEDAKDENQRQAREYQNKVETIQQNANQSITHTQDTSNERVRQLQSQLEDTLNRKDQEHAEEMQQLQNKRDADRKHYDEEIKQYQSQISQLKREQQQEVDRLTQQKNDEVEQIQARSAQQISDMNVKNNQQFRKNVVTSLITAAVGAVVGGGAIVALNSHNQPASQPATEAVSKSTTNNHSEEAKHSSQVVLQSGKKQTNNQKATKGDVLH